MIFNMISKLNKFFYLLNFIFNKVGEDYSISLITKAYIVLKIYKNCKDPRIASSFMENIFLAKRIMSIPADLPGNIAEFGSYKGISSANLSLVCKLTNRKLFIFDSFSGLPGTQEIVSGIADGKIIGYEKHDYMGQLDEVEQNITKLGKVEVCEFISGYFDESLPIFPKGEKFLLIFEDADLPSSVRTVIKYCWPLLHDGCYYFYHEARDREVVKIFFDDDWWEKTLKCKPPGMVGSGIGLPLDKNLGPFDELAGSYIGYALKKS